MEQHFKNKLKSHRVEWKKEELLDGLEQALSKKKKSSRWMGLFIIPLLLMVIIGAQWMDLEKSETHLLKAESISDLSINTFETTSPKIQEERELENETEPELTASANVEQPRKNPIVQKVKEANSSSMDLSSSSKTADILLIETGPVDQEAKQQMQNIAAVGVSILKQPTQSSFIDSELELSNLKYSEEINYLPFLQADLLEESKRELAMLPTSRYNKEERERSNLAFYIEPNASIGFLQRKYRSGYSGYTGNYEKREESETPILHFSYSMELGFLIYEKWNLQFGIEKQEMWERFEHEDYSNLNKHKYQMIPLNIGRSITVKNTEFNISAGVTYALKHSFTGLTLRSDETVIDYQSYYIRKKMGFQISVGSEYSLSHNKKLFLKGIYRRSPILGFDEISEKLHMSYSLGAGIRMYFGKGKTSESQD